ncbi:hypothetical protein M427DRAFT_27887 [Gonapodya prolifera JEL478]|uniref:Uncharacterized protein n=1 Tax=Gonapodya prolifera (strain JEL478) TaxID=1344416 RepID=A0A139AWF3_GONPJ|nr:hypothetical protein M427DRAFT_27887 [Gonapodya prolifera JEL478]|eukprot:KXS20795.1 hypothetical protein M427DRAFT_27887 [Gonapodya prolifera JEL478]
MNEFNTEMTLLSSTTVDIPKQCIIHCHALNYSYYIFPALPIAANLSNVILGTGGVLENASDVDTFGCRFVLVPRGDKRSETGRFEGEIDCDLGGRNGYIYHIIRVDEESSLGGDEIHISLVAYCSHLNSELMASQFHLKPDMKITADDGDLRRFHIRVRRADSLSAGKVSVTSELLWSCRGGATDLNCVSPCERYCYMVSNYRDPHALPPDMDAFVATLRHSRIHKFDLVARLMENFITACTDKRSSPALISYVDVPGMILRQPVCMPSETGQHRIVCLGYPRVTYDETKLVVADGQLQELTAVGLEKKVGYCNHNG